MFSFSIPLVRLLSALTLVGVAAAVSGCNSTGSSESMSLQVNVDNSARKLEEGAVVLQNTAIPLRQILEGQSADTAKSFSAFSSGVDDFDGVAKDLHKLADERKANTAEYRANAEKKAATIQDESIREDTRERSEDVVKELEGLSADYADMLKEVDGVNVGLKDIRQALSVDMSAAGIDSVRSPAKKVAGKIEDLRETVAKLAAKHRKIAQSLSTPKAQG